MLYLKRSLIAATLTASITCGSAAIGTPPPPGPPPMDTGTTYVLGKIQCTANRILSVSGQYTLDSTTHSLQLRIVQDPRGVLVSTGTITIKETGETTGPFNLTGRLGLASTSAPLSLSLAGGMMPPPPPQPVPQMVGPGPNPGPGPGTPMTSGPRVMIQGRLAGDAFDLNVAVDGFGPPSRFMTRLLPVNPMRGFVISDAQSRLYWPGILSSRRVVNLPYGTFTVPAMQVNRTGFTMFLMPNTSPMMAPPTPGMPFGIQLFGVVANNVFNITRNTVTVGYGTMDVPADKMTISPSEFPAPRR
jgi:hypothetical protein